MSSADEPRGKVRPGVERLVRLPLQTTDSARADADDEIQAYIDARVDLLMQRGLSREAALAEAVQRSGPLRAAHTQLHGSAVRREKRMQLRERLENLWQDVRYAARGLMHRPALTAMVTLTLAIGIGATTAIFSAVNTLILRPLPFPDPEELMRLSLVVPEQGPLKGMDDMVWSYPKFTMFRDEQTVFSDLAVLFASDMVITSDDVERIQGESIDSRYLPLLGVSMQRGRNFDASLDRRFDSPREVLLSDRIWKRRYSGDSSIIGKTIGIDRTPFTVIGVLSPGFTGLSGDADLFVHVTTASQAELSRAASYAYSVIGRRKRGVTAEQAQAETKLLGARIDAIYPDPIANHGAWSAKAVALDQIRVPPVVKQAAWVLFCAVALVLLVACLNVASLLLGRASTRGREMAVRLALGASRARLIRLLVTESLLLSLIGAIGSVVLAFLGTRLLSAINPNAIRAGNRIGALSMVTFDAIRFDGAALLFTLGAAITVGLAFGLAPALFATRASVAAVLKDDGRERAGRIGLTRLTARRFLVVAEISLALILLVGSGLMIRSLSNLLAVNVGADMKNVLTAQFSAPPGATPYDSLPTLYSEIVTRMKALPGVAGASIGDCAPLGGRCRITMTTKDPVLTPDMSRLTPAGIRWVTPDWLTTLRVPLRAGRAFTPEDRTGTPKVIMVNEAAAKRFWPNESAIGKRLALGQGGMDSGATVIGVVGDVRHRIDSVAMPTIYVSYNQVPRAGGMVFIRASNAASLSTDVRRVLRELAPRYPVYDMQLLTSRTAAATAQARFTAVLLVSFAAVALTLAVVGIYGVMALTVTQRTREIGIRMALGADRSRVRGMIVGEGATLVTIGTILGVLGAAAITRVLASLLFGVRPFDPLTYVALVALVVAAAIAASWIPARRATLVNPTEALRGG